MSDQVINTFMPLRICHNNVLLLAKDFLEVLKKRDLWLFMGWYDIVLRYRRTMIGPFWLVITNFISIICTAVLGSFLFKVKLGMLFPYVAIGTITWTFITGILNDSCTLFVAQMGIIKNIHMPLLGFSLRLFVRNFIAFLHNFIIIIMILAYFQIFPGVSLFILPFSILIFFLNTIAISIILGFASSRYRDLTQVVTAVISICGFLTPIIWKPDMLGDKKFLAYLNPFTHFIELFRNPLLGEFISQSTVIVVVCITVFNLLIASLIYIKFKRRLIFWL